MSYISSIPSRYLDSYDLPTGDKDFSGYIVGDATFETLPLITSSYTRNGQNFVNSSYPYFFRGSWSGGGGILTMGRTSYNVSQKSDNTRIVAWVGEGI